MEVDEEGRGGETSPADTDTTTRTQEARQPDSEDRKSTNGRQTTKRAESVGSDSGSASGPAPSKPGRRAPCPYGKDCYRYVHLRPSFFRATKESLRMAGN